jgi:hypothetical protein
LTRSNAPSISWVSAIHDPTGPKPSRTGSAVKVGFFQL